MAESLEDRGERDDERQASELVPDDAAFNGARFRNAPELMALSDVLIRRHEQFGSLAFCSIDYRWRRVGPQSKGKRAIGKLERVSGVWTAYCEYQFVVWLAADTARLAGFDDRQLEAAVFHQLAHIGQDAKGNWIKNGHDFEGFGAEIRAYGPWTEDLEIGSRAFSEAVQLGLDLDADGDDDDSDLSV